MHARFVGSVGVVEPPTVAVVVDVMRAFTVAAWAFVPFAMATSTEDSAMAVRSAPTARSLP